MPHLKRLAAEANLSVRFSCSIALEVISMRRMLCAVPLVLSVLFVLPGCKTIRIADPNIPIKKDYYRALPPGTPALRKITDPSRLPDFRGDFLQDRDGLLRALDQSIKYFGYPSSRRYYPLQGITHARAATSLVAFRELYESASSGEDLQRKIIEMFDVYESVGCDDHGTVLFTGYYTPIFDASLTPDSEYRWPLYELPPDLVKEPEGECLGRRLEDGTIVPYYSRAEIEGGALEGHELVWLNDRFAAYICTVQGSARLRLQDGSWYNVGYAGCNDLDYVSVGEKLVEDGTIPRSQLSLSGLMSFFAKNPELMDEYLAMNPRYVFFTETQGEPVGSLNVPVTTRRTIATDKSLFPRGCLAFVVTLVPSTSGNEVRQEAFRQFTLDQDRGAAIRAAGRCDIYLGVGDEAGKIAGYTMNEGALYYLFLKE
jgi:membrane-bound lytic murein transglycosylase A